MKIAQQFTAGKAIGYETKARETGDSHGTAVETPGSVPTFQPSASRTRWVMGCEVPSDESLFEVKIGINENLDNLVTDINGRRNVAGNGINMAQRIMSLADGNQILIGQPVYEILSGRSRKTYFVSAVSAWDIQSLRSI